MDSHPIDQRLAHPQPGQIRRVVLVVLLIWIVTLGVSIPLSFAHAPLMDAAAPALGPILLLLMMVMPFVMAAAAGKITYDERHPPGTTMEEGVYRAYALAVLVRLRWLLTISIGLAPLTLIVLFYRAPAIAFADSIQLWQEGLLLLPFIASLALRPVLGVALGVWSGMRLRSRWLAVLGGPLLLMLALGLELGLERLRVIRSEPIIIGDTIEYPDVSGLQSAISTLLVIDGLSSVIVLLGLFLRRSGKSQ